MRGLPLILVAALLSACLPSLARGSHVDPVQQVRNLLSAPAGFREFVYTLQNIEDYIDRVDYEEGGQKYLVREQSDAFFIRRLNHTNANPNPTTANEMERSKLYWSHYGKKYWYANGNGIHYHWVDDGRWNTNADNSILDVASMARNKAKPLLDAGILLLLKDSVKWNANRMMANTGESAKDGGTVEATYSQTQTAAVAGALIYRGGRLDGVEFSQEIYPSAMGDYPELIRTTLVKAPPRLNIKTNALHFQRPTWEVKLVSVRTNSATLGEVEFAIKPPPMPHKATARILLTNNAVMFYDGKRLFPLVRKATPPNRIIGAATLFAFAASTVILWQLVRVARNMQNKQQKP